MSTYLLHNNQFSFRLTSKKPSPSTCLFSPACVHLLLKEKEHGRTIAQRNVSPCFRTARAMSLLSTSSSSRKSDCSHTIYLNRSNEEDCFVRLGGQVLLIKWRIYLSTFSASLSKPHFCPATFCLSLPKYECSIRTDARCRRGQKPGAGRWSK